MAEDLEAEMHVLQMEYEWVLKNEVHNVIKDLDMILVEACKRFAVQIIPGEDNLVKPEKFVLSTPQTQGDLAEIESESGGHQIQCVLTLMADSICEADLALKLHKQHPVPWQTKIYPDAAWRVQQIQDAGNHLTRALSMVRQHDAGYKFRSSQEVLRLLDDIISTLNKGRTSLALPKRKSLEELIKNPAAKAFKPSLPNDVSVSFFVQAQKLVLAVYQLYINPSQKVDIQNRFQVECFVPWLNDVLMLFALALQQCQQLRDKVSVFQQYDAENKFLREPIYRNDDSTATATVTATGGHSLDLGADPFALDPNGSSQQPTPQSVKSVARREDGSGERVDEAGKVAAPPVPPRTNSPVARVVQSS